MKPNPVSRRRFLGTSAATVGSTALVACGGGSDADSAAAAEDGKAVALSGTRKSSIRPAQPVAGVSPALTPTPTPTPVPTLPPPVGNVITSLRVSATRTGLVTYSATVMPLQGQVPTGSLLVSPDDGSLRSSVLSRWNDDSAALVVVAGQANITGTAEQTVRLQLGAPVANEVALTAARVTQLVNSVRVDFGSLGVASLTNLATPERIWWANSQTVCARYRVAAPQHPTLEAVIDIQAFTDNRALVEVVVENAKLNSGAPTRPAIASYSAVVTVNGTSVATVQSTASPEGAHTAFRAWYAALWVGGDAGHRAVQAVADLQKHPLLFRCDRAGGDMSVYANDIYSPWSTGRQRGRGMGAGGDHPSIGPLPQWEARFLQTGSPAAARAVEASALAVLGWNINYRDSNTGLVPTFDQLTGRSMQSNWPVNYGTNDVMAWEVAHHPAAGLMAFACRPSPVFIEIAQKIAVWNGTWSTWGGTPTGVFGRPYQMRGKAWGIRSLAHALFLTPESMRWRTAAQSSLALNVSYLSAWATDPKGKLNTIWEWSPSNPESSYAGAGSGFNAAMWMYHYLVTEVHKAASASLLPTAAQAGFTALADWVALQPVRWVNEQANGGWRYIPYVTVLGRSRTTLDSLPTWGEQRASAVSGAPPTVSGPWMSLGGEAASTYNSFNQDGSGGSYYPSYFWAALVAAVERRVPGSAVAWTTVTSNLTNLDSWRNGFANDPRWGAVPRVSVSVPITPTVGDITNDVWTPGRDAEGRVTAASWAEVPVGRWVAVAGSRLDGLDAQVKAAAPSWANASLNWDGVAKSWSGFALDNNTGRAWLTGGGHSDSFNNGIYRWDSSRMAWAVELLPSDRSQWSAAYRSSYSSSFYPESDALSRSRRLANSLRALDDVWYDELATDGRPTARHTYSGLVYAPDTNELVMAVRRLWRYSLADGRWSKRRFFADDLAADATGGVLAWMDGESVTSTYDEVRGEVLTSSCGSNGLNRAISYKMTTQAWTWWSVPWNNRYNVADTRNGRKMVVVSPPERASAAYASPGLYWEYDLDTRSISKSGTLRFEAGLSRDDFCPLNWYYDGAALCFVAPLNRYLLWTKVADGTVKPFWIEPAAGSWIISRASFTGNVPKPFDGGNLERKCVFFPTLNAVVLMDLASKNMFLLRVG